VLGWIVWRIGSFLARRKLRENRVRLGAVAVILAVILAGLAAARAGGED
jgi:hypothetical protein